MRKFAVGKNGAFIHRDTPFVTGWEKAKSLDELCAAADKDLPDYYSKGLAWKDIETLPKIPADEFRKVVSTVREFPQRETLYTINHRFSDRTWKLGCPKQSGSGGSVQGATEGCVDGYVQVGTIHTHPGMGAFWSGTDTADQQKRGGIHVVLGLKDGLPVQWKCTFFTPNGTYDFDLWDVFEQLDMAGCNEPVKEWVERIKAAEYRRPATASYDASTSTSYTTPSLPPRNHGYTMPGWGYEDDLYDYYDQPRRRTAATAAQHGWYVPGKAGGLSEHLYTMITALVDDGNGILVFQEAVRRMGFMVSYAADDMTDALSRLINEIPVCSNTFIQGHKTWLDQIAEVLETAEIDPKNPGVPVIPKLEEEDERGVNMVIEMFKLDTGSRGVSRDDLVELTGLDTVVDLNSETQVDLDLEDCFESVGVNFLNDLDADMFGRDVKELHEFAAVIRKRLAEC